MTEQENSGNAQHNLHGINHDDFLFRLIQAGHTAIFQWIAVYLA